MPITVACTKTLVTTGALLVMQEMDRRENCFVLPQARLMQSLGRRTV